MNNKKGISGVIIALIAIGLILILIGIILISMYNNFVSLDQNVNAKWSEVENQYQRQADLIPNLVSVISSATKVETNFVQDVIAARTKWLNAKSLNEKDTAGVQMNNGISALVNAISVSENYPVLQANKQYVALTDELSGIQNRITTARGRYIEAIQTFNIAIKSFPGNIVAGIFGYSQKDYYKADITSLKTPSLGTGVLPGI